MWCILHITIVLLEKSKKFQRINLLSTLSCRFWNFWGLNNFHEISGNRNCCPRANEKRDTLSVASAVARQNVNVSTAEYGTALMSTKQLILHSEMAGITWWMQLVWDIEANSTKNYDRNETLTGSVLLPGESTLAQNLGLLVCAKNRKLLKW